MGDFWQRLRLSEFVKHMTTLMVGSGLSQIIPFLLAPVLARLYTPEQFGVLAFFLSIVVLVSGISTGRYEMAIVIAKDDKDAAALAWLSLSLSFAVSVLSIIVLKIMQWYGVVLFSGLISEQWVWLIPVMIWLYAFFQVLRFLGIRYKKFKPISAAGISDSATRGGINILLGYGFGEAFGLIIGAFSGTLSSVLVLLSSLYHKIFPVNKYFKSGRLQSMARTYRKFPIYDAPSTLFYSFGNQGVVILMTNFMGKAVVGIYSYTERLLITPISFLSGAFSQVFFQKATEFFHRNLDEFRQLLSKTMDAFILLGILPFALFAYTSKWYIPVLLGDQWLELYKFVYVLSPYIFMIFISAPLGHVLKIINRQEISLLTKILFFSLRFSALFIGYWLGFSNLFTLYLFSIFSVISLMISLILIYRFAGVRINWSVLILAMANIAVFVVLYFFTAANG